MSFRLVHTECLKGEPPALARSPDREFQLEWEGAHLRVLFQGKALQAEAYTSDWPPEKDELKLIARGELIPAPQFRAMILGAAQLELQGSGRCELMRIDRIGHGMAIDWVRLILDGEAGTARLETYRTYDDAR